MIGAGLRVSIGGAGLCAAGVLDMGWRDGADVPFHPGEDFPFEDRAVEVFECGAFVRDLDRAAKLHLLLECRRTLRVGGRIAFDASIEPASEGGELSRLASLAGLDPAADGFTKRERQVHGDPLVSIAIPAYNPGFFAASFQSALAQTYRNVEIVVCDDSEGPEIEAIAHAAASMRPVRYFRNQPRLRPRGNFTRCFHEARGEFIKFLCDDDLLAAECVASLLDAFRRSPDITLATSHRSRIDANDRALGDDANTVPIVARDAVISGASLANMMLMAGLNRIGEPSTVLFRKADLADRAPTPFGFDGVDGYGIIDMVTWAALLLKGDAVYLTTSLSSFRNHPDQRQRDPSMRVRSVESIRALQAAWLGLGLDMRSTPDTIMAKRFPPEHGADWRSQHVLGYAARRAATG